MLLDLESLRCFVQAATELTFRTAAKSVALSPAAFGDRIRRLEEELGAPLFERTTRRVVLTAAGARLLPQAQRCLEEAAACRSAVTTGADPPFDLVIGTRFELGMSFIVPALKTLERAHPKRRLHVYLGETVDLLPRVLRGELHCMVTSARLGSAGLEVAPLHEEAYAFVAARTLLAKRPLTKPEHASLHVLLDAQPDLPLFRYFLDARSPEESWPFERVQHLGGIGPIRARVLEGAGVAVLPLYYVERDIAAGRLRRLFPTTKLPSDWFRLIWRKGHPQAPALRELAAELARLPLR
jgi:LysR family transcriptional regulator, glycine cleavage system transcriptional activator